MISFRIKPYIEEATLQLVLDILVIIILATVLAIAKIPPIVYVSISIAYLVIVLFFHYRVAIQAIIDKHKKNYTTEIVCIKSFNEEYSLIGDGFGKSYIRFFYSKEMQVRKYKIKVISNNGGEKKLRSVMSFRRFLQFVVLDKQQIKYLKVTYLKNSKIILNVELVDEMNVKTNNKKNKEIKKSIHFINTSI